jgi:hypothetical protein
LVLRPARHCRHWRSKPIDSRVDRYRHVGILERRRIVDAVS